MPAAARGRGGQPEDSRRLCRFAHLLQELRRPAWVEGQEGQPAGPTAGCVNSGRRPKLVQVEKLQSSLLAEAAASAHPSCRAASTEATYAAELVR